MREPFRWNFDNVEHLARHRVSPEQVEFVLRTARAPFPRPLGDAKHLVWGQDENGLYLQVIFIYSPQGRFTLFTRVR